MTANTDRQEPRDAFLAELERESNRALISGDRMTANALAAMSELVRDNKEQPE